MDKHNLEKITIANKNYRKVIRTTENMQLVLMSLDPGVEIGMESHPGRTQFFRVESGTAHAEVEGKRYVLKDGDSLIVHPDEQHNVWCSGRCDEPCKLYTIYSPPQHRDGTVHRTKEDDPGTEEDTESDESVTSGSRIFRIPEHLKRSRSL